MKQLSLFPELDLKSDEPLQVDHSTNTLFNKMVEKPVRKPNATPPKTKTIKVPASNGGVIKPKEKPKEKKAVSEQSKKANDLFKELFDD